MPFSGFKMNENEELNQWKIIKITTCQLNGKCMKERLSNGQ